MTVDLASFWLPFGAEGALREKIFVCLGAGTEGVTPRPPYHPTVAFLFSTFDTYIQALIKHYMRKWIQ